MKNLPALLALPVIAVALTACNENDKTYIPVETVPTATPAPATTPTMAPTTAPTPTGSATTPSPTPTAGPGTGPTLVPTTSPAPTATPLPTASPTPEPTPTPGLAGRVDSGVPEGASVLVNLGDSCLSCDVVNKDNVLIADWEQFATAQLQVGLLAAGGFGEITVTVNLAQPIDPALEITSPAGNAVLPDLAGFVVSFEDSPFITLSVLPTIEIAVLNGGTVVGDVRNYGFGLFDLIGIGTLFGETNNARVYLGTEATAPYDAIRLTLTASVADLLLGINLHQVAVAGVTGSISGDVGSPIPSP